MPKFSYSAHDINGKEKRGTISAADAAEATLQLQSKGLFPAEIAPDSAPPAPAPKKTRPHAIGLQTPLHLPAALTRVPPKQLVVLTRQLATLLEAGLPLVRAIEVLHRQAAHPALKRALAEMRETLLGGSTFADALAAHPRIFSPLYINMAKAGEAGGILDAVLDRLAAYMEKAQKVRNKVKSAMTYPIVVLTASTAILIFLMAAIIPRFETIFADMLDGRSLPPLTLFVMGISNQIQQSWLLLPALAAIIVLLHLAMKRFRRGRYALDFIKLHAPLFGPLQQTALLARFARTFATLLQSGVPILQALDIVRETLSNTVVAQAVEQIHDSVRQGEPMANPVEAHRIFPPIFGGMVEVGEETGELPAMMQKIADMFEDEVDNTVAALSSIIEPVLIVLLALVVGTIVVAMFLPMVSIIGNLS